MKTVLIVVTGLPISLIKLLGITLTVIGYELIKIGAWLDKLWYQKIVLPNKRHPLPIIDKRTGHQPLPH